MSTHPDSVRSPRKIELALSHGLAPDEFEAHRQLLRITLPWAAAVPGDPYELHRSDARVMAEVGRARLWVLWATMRSEHAGLGGGGVAESEKQLAALPVDVLGDAALSFWGWLKREVPSGHPLLRSGSPSVGDRGTAAPYRPGTLRTFIGGLRWWAEQHGLDSAAFLAEVIRAGTASPKAPSARVRFTLTPGDVAAMLEVLEQEAVPSRLSGIRRRAWHARQRAALLVQILGVLRISEVGRLQRSATWAEPSERRIVMRLGWTKTGPGRDVLLGAHGGRFCAITALRAWLEVAAECGYGDMHDLWLPQVRIQPRRGEPVVTRPAYDLELDYFKRVARAAGVLTPAVDADTQLVFGTHTNRRVLPTLAANAGKDLAFLATMAGGPWARGSGVPADYVQAGAPERVLDGVLDPRTGRS